MTVLSLAAVPAISPGLTKAAGAVIFALIAAGALAAEGLAFEGRMTLCVFVAAMAGWTLTRIDDCVVALAAAAALTALGVLGEERLYGVLGDELIWLLLAAFMIAAVLRENGAAETLALRALAKARSVRRLFYGVALFTAATAFFIPSTSARAAILLPVFLALAPAIGDARIVRALALLFPTAILLSAFGSLTGAGAHLLALDAVEASSGRRIGYLEWMVLAAPVVVVCTLAATELILRLFLNTSERAKPLAPEAPVTTLGWKQIASLVLVVLTVGAWMSEDVHGLGLGLVGLIAALCLSCPQVSGVTFKTASKRVEWDLLLFLAATMALGFALIDSGAAAWLAGAVANTAHLAEGAPVLIATSVLGIALAAHLAITSRSVRAAVLIPSVALPLAALGADPTSMILLTVAGTGFCQTLPVSAKPVAVFARAATGHVDTGGLALLSAVLFPVLAAILLIAALLYWPALGIPLAR
jgi:anion transporter